MAHQLDPNPATQKKRIAIACVRCRKRKIRCSGDTGDGQPCYNCALASVHDCQFLRARTRVVADGILVDGHYSHNIPTGDASKPIHAYSHTTFRQSVHEAPIGMLPTQWSAKARARPSFLNTGPYNNYHGTGLLHPRPTARSFTLPHPDSVTTFASDASTLIDVATTDINASGFRSGLSAVGYAHNDAYNSDKSAHEAPSVAADHYSSHMGYLYNALAEDRQEVATSRY